MKQGRAKAYSNMALIKYWGKRDETLILPTNGSLSMTLDRFSTTTTITFDSDLKEDQLVMNHQEGTEKERHRVSQFLDITRSMANTTDHARVSSINEVPMAVGLASSATGFAALAGAASQALGLPLDGQALSILARQGSGSACRSIYGGFVEWRKGVRNDGLDSYGESIEPQEHWDLAMVVASVGIERKQVSSREGMRRCVATSPYYQGWLDTVTDDLATAKQALFSRDFHKLGKVTEANAFKMHALPLSADPPFTYWQEATLSVMSKVRQLRESGVRAYFTMDAGPNVAVLCKAGDTGIIQQALDGIAGVKETVVCRPGPSIVIGDRSL